MSRAFSGVLCLLDRKSDGAPSGAKDHHVFIPSSVAAKALPSLIGAPVNYSPSLDTHAKDRVSGEITHAFIVGNELRVEGFMSGDCDLLDAAGLNSLGMSYEMKHVHVVRKWPYMIFEVTEATFTGAAILRRVNAAYRDSRFQLCPTSTSPRQMSLPALGPTQPAISREMSSFALNPQRSVRLAYAY